MPGEPTPTDSERFRAGLCADCANARRIESDRGSNFYLCQLATTDPRFAKYPQLPVLACAGYRPDLRPAP
ncbi:MAG: hypothetical protein WCD23_06610 [Candidatus Acidiferrales bacterium]